MGVMKKIAIGFGSLIGVLVVAGVGTYVWAGSAVTSKLDKTYTIKASTFPVPWPISSDSPRSAESEQVARDSAVARGKHLVEARYVCVECHSTNFGGGTMIDDPAIGTLLGPNLTMDGHGFTHGPIHTRRLGGLDLHGLRASDA
jgi:hypothetical protein